MTNRNEQRREPRVAFSGFVRLRGLGEEESVEAEIRNLSALGMFVASKRVPRPGASVFCRVILGNDRRIIKGKVAWVAPDAPAQHVGAGIEFVDLCRKDSEVLRQVLDVSAPSADLDCPVPELVAKIDSDNLGRVEVEFEGLASPVKARARITEDGLVLTTKLPFLRVGSDVKVRFSSPEGTTKAAASRQGRLQAVSLGATGEDGVPRLLVELIAPEAVEADNTVGPTPPVRLEVDTEPQALTLPLPSFRERQDMRASAPQELTDPDITPVMNTMPASPGSDPEAMLEPSTPHADVAPVAYAAAEVSDTQVVRGLAAEPVCEAPPPEAAPEVAALAAEVTPVNGKPSSLQVKQVNWSPSLTAGASLPPALASMEINLTPMPEPAEQGASLPAPLILPPAPVSEPTLRVTSGRDLLPPFASQPHKQPQSVLWKVLVGAAVAAVAVALLLLSGDEAKRMVPSASSQVPAEPSPQPQGIRIEALPAALPKPAAPSWATKKPVVKPAVAAVDGEWRPISDPSWPFTVAVEGAETTVFVPLAGSPSGHRVYNVTQPNGVGAILPQGELSSHAGKFVVNEAGITQVWAEMRDNGLHLRVLFGRNVAAHTATLEAEGLRVVATRR